VFVRSSRAGEFADQAIAVGAKIVWFQLGVLDHEAAARVEAAGLSMIMDRCPAIELRA
jgi:predicted CoA-binding protein